MIAGTLECPRHYCTMQTTTSNMRKKEKCAGHSAITAELLAHCCLTECLDKCFLIHDLFAPYMPWESNHLLATEVANLKVDLMDAKGFVQTLKWTMTSVLIVLLLFFYKDDVGRYGITIAQLS